MQTIAHYYQEFVVLMTFLAGRFSKGGFQKMFFAVKFVNEVHRLYGIITKNTVSPKFWVRFINKSFLYFFIFPIIMIFVISMSYGLYMVMV